MDQELEDVDDNAESTYNVSESRAFRIRESVAQTVQYSRLSWELPGKSLPTSAV